MMNRAWTWGLAAAIAVVMPGCVNRGAQEQAKQTAAVVTDPVKSVLTASPETTTVFDELEITGDMVTSQDAQIGAKLSGKLVGVFVREGDQVAAGQVIASLDASSIRYQLQQAIAQLSGAQAQLSQAKANEAIGPSRTTAAVRSAEAQLRSARAQLEKSLKGARDEERAQAEWNVKNAASNLETVKREVERVKKLVDEGAVERKRLETVQNQYIAAQSAYNSALQAQLILKNGVRPEDIQSAKEAVQQAEEQVRSAKASKGLDVLLSQQVAGAQAQVASAEAQVSLIKQTLSDTEVRSPFAGRVAGRPLEAGTVVAPGTPIARIIGGTGTYFEGQVPETTLSRLSIGRPVSILVQALNGQALNGKIVAISPTGSNIGRLFSVRISVESGLEMVKPGMFARGIIRLDSVEGATVVPASAVLNGAGRRYVVVAEGDTAKLMTVKTGLAKGDKVQVFGLPASAKVIVQGQEGLLDGSKIRIGGASGEALTGVKEGGA